MRRARASGEAQVSHGRCHASDVPASGRIAARAPVSYAAQSVSQRPTRSKAIADGGLLIRDGRIAACGDYATLRDRASGRFDRGSARRLSAAGLRRHARSFSAAARARRTWAGRCWTGWSTARCRKRRAWRMQSYARNVARGFVHGAGVARHHHGAGVRRALRCRNGRAVRSRRRSGACASSAGHGASDRLLRAELHQTPERAYRDSSDTDPALSWPAAACCTRSRRASRFPTSEAMLEVCQTLLREHTGCASRRTSTRIRRRSRKWRGSFRGLRIIWRCTNASGLSGRGAVMAHNVHPTDSELDRLAASGAAVAHCPMQQRGARQRHVSV